MAKKKEPAPSEAEQVEVESQTPVPEVPAPEQEQASSNEGLGEQLEATAQAAATPPEPAPSFMETLRSQGLDLPQDEKQAADFLVGAFKQAREMQQLAQYGQLYVQHQSDFEKWRQSQQKPQAEEKPWWADMWNPPEYNPAWHKMVAHDDKGNLVSLPGAPPDIPLKIAAYNQYRQDAAEKFLSNPYQFMEQGVQKIVPKMVQEAIEKSFGQHTEKTVAQEFAKENADWLYQKGANNQILSDPITGERMLSQWGQRFKEYAVQAGKLGLQTVNAQREYAMGMVQRDFALSQLQNAQGQQQATPPLTPREKANQDFLDKAPKKAPSRTGQAVEPPQGQLSLQEMLSRSFRENGIEQIA